MLQDGLPCIRTEFGFHTASSPSSSGLGLGTGSGVGATSQSRQVSPSRSPYSARPYSLQREMHGAFLSAATARAARFEAAIKAVTSESVLGAGQSHGDLRLGAGLRGAVDAERVLAGMARSKVGVRGVTRGSGMSSSTRPAKV